LTSNKAPDKAQRMLDIAVENRDRLTRLLNDFLYLERLHSGRLELRPEPCSAVDLVDKARDAMRSIAQEACVDLQSAARPAQFTADPDRIV
jgi:two-component system sensor histidine kinase VicK